MNTRLAARIRSGWLWIKANDVQLKILFSVVAALYVLAEYSMKGHEAKVEKTLKYVERHTQFEVAAARRKLDAFWLSKPVSEWQKLLNPANYNTVVPDMMQKRDLLGEIKVLTAFYNELSQCVNKRICDGPTACQFFFEEVQSFRHNYKWHLDELQDGWKESGGTAINEMVDHACSKDAASYCAKTPKSPYCRKPTSA